MKYSIIILLEERHEDFSRFVGNLYKHFTERGKSFEILIMANGTGGFLRKELPQLRRCNDRIKLFELSTRTPQAVSLNAGLKESSGDIIIICGSYQQLTNRSLNDLLDSLDSETDIVVPWRQGRVDPFFNQLQSRLFNAVARRITGSPVHDLSSTVRICRREVLEEIKLYGNMYRFLPILAARKGFKTREIECEHYQERGKIGFYRLSMYVTRIIDIGTIYFNSRFIKKPMRFFSTIGITFLICGFLIIFYVSIQRLFMGHPIGGRPILLLAILFMTLGIQAASVGLLGEITAFTHGRHKKEYTIEKKIE